MTLKEQNHLLHDWRFWGRQNQFEPTYRAWTYWLIMAGRGFGKTRTGAEWVREQVKKKPIVNLIGATADDARDIMIEGESGILAICPPDERPKYIAHKRRLDWPNGARSLIFTADEPDRLRGKQHYALWADELAAWRYPDSWDQAMLGLRLGENPQAVITTTPRPLKVLKDLLVDEATVLTTGSTYENRSNLARSFYKTIITKYEGTRLGRQELHAELLDDLPGALWQRSRIDQLRVAAPPPLRRVVVAIDPAVSTKEGSDETGIVAAGIGELDGHGYTLADWSGVFTPDEWGRKAVLLFQQLKADYIIAEANNGGDLVEQNIRVVAKSMNVSVTVKLVHATRGKFIRAEPVSSLTEQGRDHHVGSFPQLEDQMCGFTADFNREKMGFSPDRMDAKVWAYHELMILGFPGSNLLDYYAQKEIEAAALKKANS